MNSRGPIVLPFASAVFCVIGLLLTRQHLAPLSAESTSSVLAADDLPRGPGSRRPAIHNPSAKQQSLAPSVSSETGDNEILLTRRCLSLAESDPLAAMEMALAHHLESVDPGLLPTLMRQWAKEDFDGAYTWTKRQERGAWRDDMLARLAYLRARADPPASADLVVIDIPAGPIRDEAIISVLHQWALRDSEAATLWAESFDNPALRNRALAEVAGIVSTTRTR